MAITLHSQLSPSTVQYGEAIIEYANPAAAYKPGSWVYFSADSTVTWLDKDVAGSLLVHPGLLSSRDRGAAAGARKTVDDAYAATDAVPVIVGKISGRMIVVSAVADQGATRQKLSNWQIGDDGEAIIFSTGRKLPIVNSRAVVDDDRFMLCQYMELG